MTVLFSLFDSTILTDMLKGMADVVPNVLGALVIAIAGYIIAKIVSASIKKVLTKINIDKISDKLNEIDIVERSKVNIKISTILSKIVYYFILLLALVAATDVLKMPAVSNLVASIFDLIPNIIVAGIILVLGILISDALRNMTQTALTSLGVPSARLIASLVFYFLFINIVISALSQAKVNTDFLSQNISLLIGGGVLAFAIGYGLASKNSMSNFLASYYSKGKFEVGDVVTIQEVTGKIIEIDKSSLVLVKDDGNKVIFPLNHISNTKIEIHNN